MLVGSSSIGQSSDVWSWWWLVMRDDYGISGRGCGCAGCGGGGHGGHTEVVLVDILVMVDIVEMVVGW